MGPCWVSTRSQSYPLCASCSATVGLWALRNRPILGCPARSCFLNSDPLSAGSGMGILLEVELMSVPYGAMGAANGGLIFGGGCDPGTGSQNPHPLAKDARRVGTLAL